MLEIPLVVDKDFDDMEEVAIASGRLFEEMDLHLPPARCLARTVAYSFMPETAVRVSSGQGLAVDFRKKCGEMRFFNFHRVFL